ncbi:unnamed protein product [Effrenium voratum]|nr:unnamed protein product [Effrenium voratum]
MQVDPKVLYHVFQHSYSPHAQERRQAEQFLHQAAGSRNLLPALLQVADAAQAEVPIRQAAAIQLKHQLRDWEGDKYREEDKAPIRHQLVDSVAKAVQESCVRVQLVESFRLVALYDYPDRWPGVLQRLLQGLCSEQSAQTMCSLLLLRQLFKLLEMRSAERRRELQDLSAQSLPMLLKLAPVLGEAAQKKSPEALEMLKLVLKCFYSAVRMAVPEQVQKDIQQWMGLLLGVLDLEMAMPSSALEQEVLEASCEAKCRKWVFQILPGAPAELGQCQWPVPGSKRHLGAKEIPQPGTVVPGGGVPQGPGIPGRERATANALKPDLQHLLELGIFPQVRFGEAELQLWSEDPEELLRELLSDCDSDSRPHQAAIELVERLLLYRNKEVLLPLFQFCRQHLETEATDAAACSNQDGALVLLGVMSEYLVELDPMQEDQARRKRRGKKVQGVSVEEIMTRYVRPAMTSPVGFLRLRGAWCAAQFARQAVRLGRPGAAGAAACDCLRLLGDQELLVRVLGAGCLEAFLQREEEEVRTAFVLHLAPTLEQLIRLLQQIQLEVCLLRGSTFNIHGQVYWARDLEKSLTVSNGPPERRWRKRCRALSRPFLKRWSPLLRSSSLAWRSNSARPRRTTKRTSCMLLLEPLQPFSACWQRALVSSTLRGLSCSGLLSVPKVLAIRLVALGNGRAGGFKSPAAAWERDPVAVLLAMLSAQSRADPVAVLLAMLSAPKPILACFKWLLLSRQEYQILKKAKELFKTVNVQTGCCADCPYKQLNKMERMYLHRILKDNSRWGANKKFIKTFQEQIIDMQKKDSDGGETITEGEFCNAALYAVQEYMEKIVDQMAHEIKKEYKKDEEMAEAP